MMRLIRAAAVIARRDYVATVWSRSFLLFLLGPLIPFLFGGIFGAIAGDDARLLTRTRVAVIADAAQAAIIRRTAAALESERFPAIRTVAPAGAPRTQALALLGGDGTDAVLAGRTLFAPAPVAEDLARPLALLADLSGRAALSVRPRPLDRQIVSRPSERRSGGLTDVARGGQLALVVLVVVLSGMLVSNLVEEKSNKVIEVLAAAVPVDAIFAGKLVGMLCVSLTGIAAWLAIAIAGGLLTFGDVLADLTIPAVGWPIFLGLGFGYFATSYLLIGGLLLGIGSQAGTVREVQTLSMPLTMGQLVIVAFAAAGVGQPDGKIALAAAAFPWSSPFAMLARAAERPELWPHLAAFGWQLLWLAVVVRLSAALFRRGVLKGGNGTGWLKRWRRTPT